MLVRERSTGVLFAAKIMSKQQLQEEDQFNNIITERRVLREAGPHPFVIECHSGFQTADAVVLILEYLAGGDMYDLLKKYGCLSEDQARFYLAEILVGLQELHRLNFVFRDLKLENILLDHKGHVRLTDFGLSGRVASPKWNDRTITDISGTAIYQAPEILADRGHGRVVDYWALGVLAHVILTGRPPFAAGGDRRELYHLIQTKDLDLDSDERLKDVSAEGRDLIRRLLERDPSKRLGSEDEEQIAIRTHPFFQGIDWSALLRFEVAPPLEPPCQPVPEFPGSRSESDSRSGNTTNDASDDTKEVEQRVQNKLARNPKKSNSIRRRLGDTRKKDSSSHLDAVEYKVVDVPETEPPRISIGLDFRGKSEEANTRTWTGTTDDFGRVLEDSSVQ